MVNSDKVFLFNILNYLSSGSQRSISSLTATADGSVTERLAMIVDALTMPGATDVEFQY
jgi:hypothetical protein